MPTESPRPPTPSLPALAVRFRRALGPLLALSLLACGQAVADPADPWQPPPVDLGDAAVVAGSRLRPLVYRAEGEPPVRTSRYLDTARDEECEFSLADDGSYRCFPRAVAGAPLSGPLYADAACTVPLFTASLLSDLEPRYIALDEVRGCSVGRRLYELGTEFEGKPYLGPDGAFRLVNAGRAFELGPPIANDDFVRAAEVESAAVAGRLGGRQLSAADGTGTLLGFYDQEHDAPCDVRPTSDGVRCVESPSYGQGWWSGADPIDGVECWQLVLEADACAPPRYGLVVDSFDPFAYGIHEVVPAEAVSAPSDAVSACLEAGRAFMTGPPYVMGELVAPAVFPRLESSPRRGRRLDAEWLANAEGTVVLPDDETHYDLTDRELGVACRLGPARDGTTRCLPETIGVSYFADAACTVPLVMRAAGAAPQAFVSTSLEGAARIFQGPNPSAEPFAGAAYQLVTVTGSEYTCQPAAATDTVLVEAGAELPPSSFVEYGLEVL